MCSAIADAGRAGLARQDGKKVVKLNTNPVVIFLELRHGFVVTLQECNNL